MESKTYSSYVDFRCHSYLRPNSKRIHNWAHRSLPTRRIRSSSLPSRTLSGSSDGNERDTNTHRYCDRQRYVIKCKCPYFGLLARHRSRCNHCGNCSYWDTLVQRFSKANQALRFSRRIKITSIYIAIRTRYSP